MTDRPQKLPVPRRRDAFAGRVRARLVGARRDACVALLAHVPVLAVGGIPEAHGVFGIATLFDFAAAADFGLPDEACTAESGA